MSDTKTIGFKADVDDQSLLERIASQYKKKQGVRISVSMILRLGLRALAKQEGLK